MLEIFLIQPQKILFDTYYILKELDLHTIHQLYVFKITRIGIRMKV